MYHNWNPHNPTRSLSDNSCHHHRYRLMENRNTRSARFWILKWTNAADRKIDYTTWYIGQVMKVLTRKLHGYQHETSPIHPNSASYSTNNTLISRAPRIAEREFPITRHIAARPPASFFLPFLFPFLSFPFSPSEMFSPFFIHSILNFPRLLTFYISPYYITNTPSPVLLLIVPSPATLTLTFPILITTLLCA